MAINSIDEFWDEAEKTVPKCPKARRIQDLEARLASQERALEVAAGALKRISAEELLGAQFPDFDGGWDSAWDECKEIANTALTQIEGEGEKNNEA